MLAVAVWSVMIVICTVVFLLLWCAIILKLKPSRVNVSDVALGHLCGHSLLYISYGCDFSTRAQRTGGG